MMRAGALGLLLPGLVRIRPTLTPMAAAGLVVLMICATILTPILVSPEPLMMAVPATVGVVAACVGTLASISRLFALAHRPSLFRRTHAWAILSYTNSPRLMA